MPFTLFGIRMGMFFIRDRRKEGVEIKAEWKINGLYKADAQKVAEELESLGDSYTLSDVVERAKDISSEMHDVFEWDDSIAGMKYREVQASKMIQALIVKVENKKVSEPVRYFVSTGNRDKSYTPVRLVVRNEDAYKELLNRAYAELRAFKKKYSTLSELEEILSLID